ncbi:MAG: hypothetical protein WD049_06020 [Candidatus Paceibacterota bacterium]
MPSKQAHLAAVARNRKAGSILLQQDDDCLPWVVVCAFYEGLHLVEALLSIDEKAPRRHCPDHETRNDVLRRTNRYERIWRSYRQLQQASMVARYLSFHGDGQTYSRFTDYLTRDEIEQKVVNDWLHQIHKSVNKLVKLPDLQTSSATTQPNSQP